MGLERLQIRLKPEQSQAFREIAQAQGMSIAQVARRALDLGLQALQQENQTIRQQAALERARRLRQSMPLLPLDAVQDIGQMRQERNADLQSCN